MRTGLLNKNYSTSRIDQNTEPPQNPLNLLHETCERLLNECAQRNRKSLKFRFIDLKPIDLNCNLQTANVSHNHYNEMNSTPTCHSNINNNNNNKYGIYNQKLFQYNANIQSDEEILDYSMNPMKRSSFSPSSSSSPPSLPSTSSNSNSPNNSNLSTDASISAPSNILFNNSMSNFPYSCFASYALKMNNNNNNSNNLPMHSMNDLIQNLLFQQKLNDPNMLHLLQQYLSNFPSYGLFDRQDIQTKQNASSFSDNYNEYFKLLTNFINYFSLLNNLTTDNSNISSNTDVNMISHGKRL